MPKFSGMLLASDIDGTLLDPEGGLPRENRDAIIYFIENGGCFTVASGRGRQSFEKVRPVIPRNAPAILSNGGLIIDYASGGEQTVIYEDLLPDGAEEYIELAVDRFPDIGVETYMRDGIRSYNPNENTWLHFNYVGVADIVEVVNSPSELRGPFNKVIFTQGPERLAEFAEWFSAEVGDKFDLVFSVPILYEMQRLGTNKAAGVIRLAETLGISREKIFSAGDEDNDLAMIEAFHSFAPGNAKEIVKKKAGHVVCPCGNGAIADVIRIIEREYCSDFVL